MKTRLSIFICFFLPVLGFFEQGYAAQWYLGGGAGYEWSLDADFHDEDSLSTDPPALFGPGPGSDGRSFGAYGDFGSLPVLEVSAGVQPLPWLRTDLSLAFRPEADYSAQANFINVPGEQPVDAEAKAWTGMVNCFFELAELIHLNWGPFKPYVGGGIGLSYNEIGRVTYRFPGLTRHKLSVTPSGSHVDFAFKVSVGTGVRLTEKLFLDISYRYTDLGSMKTDRGNMYMDFLPAGIDIGETSAPFRTHGVVAGFRYLLY